MSKVKRKQSGPERPASPIGRRAWLVVATVLLAAGVLATAVALRGGQSPQTGSPQAPPAAQAGQGQVTAVADNSTFGRLNGRWLRPDGGYVLEIRGADAGGAIEVTYLNPRPINVSRTEATREGSALKVFVELRAPGYPGSRYTLIYDPERDQLEGAYFQAVLGQTFDVFFTRIK